MAKIQSNNLALEIKFNRFEDEWIAYEISFLWKYKIIINDDILKKDRWWDRRKYGNFLVNDYEKDYLIETLKKVLETNKSEYWEPIEPDAKIAIYPESYFPFLKDHWVKVDDTCEKIIQVDNDKQDTNNYELFTIITFIDTYNFIDCRSYSSEGISLHLIVTRKDLEKFVTDLETEYCELMNRHQR